MTPTGGGGYDRLAHAYVWLERLAFGGALERARRRHLATLAGDDRVRRVLLVGEGDGRLLTALLRSAPHARVVCVDSSGGMLRRARERAVAAGSAARVDFVHADVRTLPLDAAGFDAVVTPFVLDLFDADDLGPVVASLATALRPGGWWLHVDFALPARGWRRWRAQLWLAGLYGFFRSTTTMSARGLVDPSPGLATAGLVRVEEVTAQAGLLTSRLYRKATRRDGGPAAGTTGQDVRIRDP